MSIVKRIEYWDIVRETKQYPSGGYYESQTSQKKREQDLDAETEDDLFVKFYKLNNSLRYCNGSYYKFVDANDQKAYDDWKKNLSHQRSFNLFYGNGVVD